MAREQPLSLRAQWLGVRLKAARKQAGYTLQQVGEYLKLKHGTISRFENGVYRIRPSYVRDLIDFYGISDRRTREALLQLNDDAWRKDIWNVTIEGLESEFMDYSWLEARAVHLYVYDPLLISGLLQTSDYAAAITEAGCGGPDDDEMRRAIDVRKARQQIFSRVKPTRFTAVLEEIALRRAIGAVDVRRRQYEHLMDLAALDFIDIRIMDPESGWHPGLHGPFTLMEMPAPHPTVAYTEDLVGRAFLEEESKVAKYQAAYDALYRSARNSTESMKYLRTLAKECQ